MLLINVLYHDFAVYKQVTCRKYIIRLSLCTKLQKYWLEIWNLVRTSDIRDIFSLGVFGSSVKIDNLYPSFSVYISLCILLSLLVVVEVVIIILLTYFPNGLVFSKLRWRNASSIIRRYGGSRRLQSALAGSSRLSPCESRELNIRGEEKNGFDEIYAAETNHFHVNPAILFILSSAGWKNSFWCLLRQKRQQWFLRCRRAWQQLSLLCSWLYMLTFGLQISSLFIEIRTFWWAPTTCITACMCCGFFIFCGCTLVWCILLFLLISRCFGNFTQSEI
jgi:hypothetical protein